MSIRNIDKSTGLTHTDRGVTEDEQFYLQTGRWIFRKGSPEKNVELTQQQSKTAADYLDTEDLSYLQTVPCEINGKSIKRTAEGIVVTFGIRNLGQDPKVKIF